MAVIHHFHCRSLSIGTWRRVGQNAMDLVVFYSLGENPCLTYYINNESAGYKIEFPFSFIKGITLENGGPSEDGSSRPAGLLVELNRPPNFLMDSSGGGGFLNCGDFTEEQQASQIMVHHLGGDPRALNEQLTKLTLLDCYRNRHNTFIDNVIAASAPVSPVGHRPASQPNALSHPNMAMFQDNGFGMNTLHPGVPRGHKRTRSRSVPAIIDFSMLQTPMPSFHIQHPSTTFTDPNIFAPIPQHHNQLINAGSNLRIDTSSGYGLDLRQYPMSAATTTSPSDYASPSFFSSGPHIDTLPASNYTNSYSLPFLSPMAEHPTMIQPSVSPLSTISHGDPIIAGHSPPLSNLTRSASVDFLGMHHDHHSSLSDDGLILSEMYSKQTLNLPLRSPGMDDSTLHMHLHDEPSTEEMDMHHLLSFGTIDPSNLSSDHGVM